MKGWSSQFIDRQILKVYVFQSLRRLPLSLTLAAVSPKCDAFPQSVRGNAASGRLAPVIGRPATSSHRFQYEVRRQYNRFIMAKSTLDQPRNRRFQLRAMATEETLIRMAAERQRRERNGFHYA